MLLFAFCADSLFPAIVGMFHGNYIHIFKVLAAPTIPFLITIKQIGTRLATGGGPWLPVTGSYAMVMSYWFELLTSTALYPMTIALLAGKRRLARVLGVFAVFWVLLTLFGFVRATCGWNVDVCGW
ncbi:hypothetical protein [Rhodopila globiformis]|uniref:Uncharacterized protein n=1 Tax=Rhodopila globiformis TaxID=1071 RepID=A0A2S6NJC8_RHOGL|nr:hypothetical protein [Rhodopila globiformis]PPQ34949.1 hypothetical protein CCS01_09195 [Rhodopila globiformis]